VEPASWRRVLSPGRVAGTAPLALGVELRVRERPHHDPWASRRVRAATVRDLAGTPELMVGLRPLGRSHSTGAWIRADVAWEALRRCTGRFVEPQRRWFTELFGIAHDVRVLGGFRDESDWITLDTVESALLWPHLAEAAAREIPIIAAAKNLDVTLAGPATVDVELS